MLVIEDDCDIQMILQMALEVVGGLSYRACGSAAEGLEALERDLPDLLVLDWMMPITDGADVLRCLRGNPRTAPLPVVVLTGKALPNEIARMKALGATEVLAKPFDPLTLSEQLERIFLNSVAQKTDGGIVTSGSDKGRFPRP